MPLFDYACPQCDARITDVLIRTEDHMVWCIECDRIMRRLPAAPAVHFRGSGFYATDYRPNRQKASD